MSDIVPSIEDPVDYLETNLMEHQHFICEKTILKKLSTRVIIMLRHTQNPTKIVTDITYLSLR